MVGKKRTRKEEEDASKKKSRATEEEETVVVPPAATTQVAAATAAPPAAAPAAAVVHKQPASMAPKKSPPRKTTRVQQATPYDKQPQFNKADDTPTKVPVPLVHPAATKTSTKQSTLKSEDSPMHSPNKLLTPRRAISSVPCALLFLVAFLLWCTVTLLGLVLSERMDHELQMWQLRQLLTKSEAIGTPLHPDECQEHVNHWKGLAGKLESQKKGMLKEFGEKLAKLDLME